MSLSETAKDRLKASYKPAAGVLLPDIQRHVMRQSQFKDADRDTVHVHPSEMSKSSWCPRNSYYRIIGTLVETSPKNPSFRMSNAFAEGHSIHYKWQSWLRDMGILWGHWACREGHREVGVSLETCSSCGEDLEYKEVPFYSEEYRIIGHADGLVTQYGVNRLIEIKSIGVGTLRFEAPRLFDRLQSGDQTLDEVWRHIKRPFRTHLLQGLLYLELAQMSEDSVLSSVDEIVFIYEWKATGDVREFVIKRSPDLVADLLEKARTVSISVRREGEVLPDRPEGVSVGNDPCRSCEYRHTCWEIDESSTPERRPKVSETTVRKSTNSRRRRRALS